MRLTAPLENLWEASGKPLVQIRCGSGVPPEVICQGISHSLPIVFLVIPKNFTEVSQRIPSFPAIPYMFQIGSSQVLQKCPRRTFPRGSSEVPLRHFPEGPKRFYSSQSHRSTSAETLELICGTSVLPRAFLMYLRKSGVFLRYLKYLLGTLGISLYLVESLRYSKGTSVVTLWSFWVTAISLGYIRDVSLGHLCGYSQVLLK